MVVLVITNPSGIMREPELASGSHAPEIAGDDVVRLRREDLAALTAAYLRDNRAPAQWVL